MTDTFDPEAFGKYYLVDKIATGGMAEIFKAKTYSHGGFQNYLVIKRILSHLSENEDFVSMFIDEAKVSVALQHPNIVRIYDFGKLADHYYIAMEWVDGKDLRNLLRRLAKQRRYLPLEFVVLIAHEVCKGLAHAHAKRNHQGNRIGIVHRDISPSNVLVSYEGEVKIADFGIAKAESNAYSTDAGVLKGKFEYMSPEQARGEDIDHRSDLFSLGILLHETLTGRRLFKRGSDVSTLDAIKSVDIVPPTQINGRIPKPLERIVMRALAADRDDRYADAAEMQRDLRELMLPDTADTLRPKLARLLHESFADDIGEERSRLERGSRIADQLYRDAPHLWDEHTQSTVARSPSAASRRSLLVPGLLAALALLAVAAAAAAVVVLPTLLAPPEAPPPAEIEPIPVAGSVDVLVLPAARITVDGAIAAEAASTLAIDDLAPGDHSVMLEADGYEPTTTTVTVRAGERVVVRQTLSPVAVTRPTPPQSGRPSAEVAPREEAPAPPAAAAPGLLTVALIGGGWADVYVDGRKLPKPAPLRDVGLAAGTHKVRVHNPDLGLDYTETVSVTSGGSVTVRARPR